MGIQAKRIIMRSEWDVADAIKAGQLVHVLPEWALAPADIVPLVPQRKGMSARVSTFIAFVNAHFSPIPSWRS